MGANCAWGTATIYTADRLANLEPGTSESSEGACYRNASITTDFIDNGIVPNTKEFKYSSSDGSCYPCSVDYPNKVTAGSCLGVNMNPKCASDAATGNMMSFTRKNDDDAYQADKNKCCINSALTIDNYTCDPGYRSMNSGDCINQMASLCGTASGFSSNKTACKEFCAIEAAGIKNTCDNLIYTYCESSDGLSDTSCDCINNYNSIEEAGLAIGVVGDTVCTYSKCQSGSNPILTSAMTNKDCSICVAINANNTVIDSTGSPATFTATCNIGDSSGGPTSLSNTVGATNMITSLGDFSGGFSSWITTNWIMLTIFIVLLIGIIAAVFFIL